VRERVSPFPLGRDHSVWLCPSPEIFLTTEWKIVRYGAFLVLILQTNFLHIVP